MSRVRPIKNIAYNGLVLPIFEESRDGDFDSGLESDFVKIIIINFLRFSFFFLLFKTWK